MKWFLKLERKFGKYAIPNIMYFMLACYIIGLAIRWFAPTVNVNGVEQEFFDAFLSLNVDKIMQGQVWRILTFLLDPPSSNLFFAVFMIWMYFQIGQVLEQVWGSFRFNVYLLGGILLNVVASFVAYFAFGQVFSMGTTYINLSLFMAYAVTFPDMIFRLFFVIPIKAKFLAIADGVLYLLMMVACLLSRNWGGAVEILLSVLNFVVFFLITRDYKRVRPKTLIKQQKFKSEVRKGKLNKGSHCCAVCGITDIDDPDMTFRYCSKCEGNYEYCQNHLYTHVHVTGRDKMTS